MQAERLKFLLPSSLVSIFLNIVLNILLIPKYGYIGACLATAFAALISVLVTYYYGNKFYPLPIQHKKVFLFYFIILIFTLPIYPIIISDAHFFIKIISKSIFLILFGVTGAMIGYIDFATVKKIFAMLSSKIISMVK